MFPSFRLKAELQTAPVGDRRYFDPSGTITAGPISTLALRRSASLMNTGTAASRAKSGVALASSTPIDSGSESWNDSLLMRVRHRSVFFFSRRSGRSRDGRRGRHAGRDREQKNQRGI